MPRPRHPDRERPVDHARPAPDARPSPVVGVLDAPDGEHGWLRAPDLRPRADVLTNTGVDEKLGEQSSDDNCGQRPMTHRDAELVALGTGRHRHSLREVEVDKGRRHPLFVEGEALPRDLARVRRRVAKNLDDRGVGRASRVMMATRKVPSNSFTRGVPLNNGTAHSIPDTPRTR